MFITAGVIFLVVVAGIIVLLLNLQVFKPQIEAAASNALGMEVRIKGRLGIDLFSDFGISRRSRWTTSMGPYETFHVLLSTDTGDLYKHKYPE